MRIVAAEPQLINDLVDEIEVLARDEQTSFNVYAGRHPTLGKMVVIEGEDGTGVVVELD